MSIVELTAPEASIHSLQGNIIKSHLKEYSDVIKKAWEGYDASKTIKSIDDISAMVSTNHVYRITFDDDDIIIAKLSTFGKYEHFKEDHRIIHSLSNNLLYPFENLLAKSLLKITACISIATNMLKPTFGWYFITQPVLWTACRAVWTSTISVN